MPQLYFEQNGRKKYLAESTKTLKCEITYKNTKFNGLFILLTLFETRNIGKYKKRQDSAIMEIVQDDQDIFLGTRIDSIPVLLIKGRAL